MGELVDLEVVPNPLDIVQLRRILRQPINGEPVAACGQRRKRQLGGVDRPIILDQHHRFDRLLSRLGRVEPVQVFKMSDEVAAALGPAGEHNELARDVIERTEHGDLLRLPRCGDTQISAGLGPGAGEVGMRQRLALVPVEQNDVAGFGLLLAQLQTQADTFDLGGDLAALQRVTRTSPTKLFLRSALDNCERLIRTPSRASISLRSRGIVQFGRSATGSSSSGSATRKAASLFTGAGPGATVAFSASIPPFMNALRHSRTVSSRTPKASAIRGLVQPASVSSTARALSASPRSREPARAAKSAR